MEISVNATAEKVVTDKKFVAAGNYKQIKLKLNLSADFDNLVVRVTLNNKSVTAINGECYLPPLKTGRYIFGVYGFATVNGELVKRISPQPTYLVVTYGSCNEDDESPSELEEYYSRVNRLIDEDIEKYTKKAVDRANDISETLETKLANGEFKGEKGDKGNDGAQGAKGDTGPQGEQGPKGEKGEQGAPGTTDYTQLLNLPVTPITTKEFEISKFKENSDSTYVVITDGGVSIKNSGNECCVLSKGSKIFVVTDKYATMATVITGLGGFFISDITNESEWNLEDYFPSRSEVDDMIDYIDLDGKNATKCYVNYKNSDGKMILPTLQEFCETTEQRIKDCETKFSNYQPIMQFGTGLKFENGVLSLDIENGDNLKYGTSTTQAEETEENEVVTNE